MNFRHHPLWILTLWGVGVLLGCPWGRAESLTAYVGTYTGGGSRGIYAFAFDTDTGDTGTVRLVAGSQNPSFLALHPKAKVIYAVNELDEVEGEPGGGLSAFAILDDGSLQILNQVSTVGGSPCHLAVTPGGGAVLVANYGGGSVVSYRLEADGRIGSRASFVQHRGSSVDPARQTGPHAHGVHLDPAGRFAFVPDLGLDQVRVYRVDPATGVLTPHEPASASLDPGSGPRHVALHPDGTFAWALNELRSTVTAFRLDSRAGVLTPVATVSTLPKEYRGNNSTAEIMVHPRGRFLYASNRGHDSVAVFVIDPKTGELDPVQHQPTGGRTPRNFNLTPDGRWLLAAGQGSDNVTVFQVDETTGRLRRHGAGVVVPSPVCLVFVEP